MVVDLLQKYVIQLNLAINQASRYQCFYFISRSSYQKLEYVSVSESTINKLLSFRMLPNRKSDLHQEAFELLPVQLFTNSTCKITQSFKYRAIPLAISWFRVTHNRSQPLSPVDLMTYQCSPLDQGCFIEARITFKTDVQGTCVKTRGPVILDPQVQHLVSTEKVLMQNLKASTNIEGQQIPINFKLKPDSLSMNCNKNQNCQYLMKFQALPQFRTKQQSNVLVFSVKNYSDTMTKYFSAVLKKHPRVKVTQFDVKFESRVQRDLFLTMLNRRLSKLHQVRMHHPLPQTPHHLPSNLHIAPINSVQNLSNTSHNQPNIIPSSLKLSPPPETYNPNSVKYSAQQKALRQTYNAPQLKNEIENLFGNDPPKKQKQYLNIFQDSVLSQDDKDNLNLQNSFLILQGQDRNYRDRSLKSQSINTEKQRQKFVARNLQEAQAKINELLGDVYLLKQENKSLNLELIQIKSDKNVDIMKQKIKMLEQENSKLTLQKNKMSKDFYNVQVKLKKQVGEKVIMKEMFDQLKSQLGDTNVSTDKDRNRSKELIIGNRSDKKRDSSPSNPSSRYVPQNVFEKAPTNYMSGPANVKLYSTLNIN